MFIKVVCIDPSGELLSAIVPIAEILFVQEVRGIKQEKHKSTISLRDNTSLLCCATVSEVYVLLLGAQAR